MYKYINFKCKLRFQIALELQNNFIIVTNILLNLSTVILDYYYINRSLLVYTKFSI